MDKHYSIESLKEIAGDDQEFMAIVAKTFLEEITPDLKAMEEAIENDNKPLVYQFAHKMKPNLEMFGISLKKEISSIEKWTRSTKNKDTIANTAHTVSITLREVFKEIMADFS